MNLSEFDIIVLSTSGGKDSQATLDVTHKLALEQGVADRITAVHADLGRMHWAGTAELAAEQAAHYGIPFEVVSRPQGDLLDHVEAKRMWPAPGTPYCQSDHKRGQILKLVTRLVDAWRARQAAQGLPVRRCRVLQIWGIRADESTDRAAEKPWIADMGSKFSNGKRLVSRWLPIHDWTEAQVWERIRATGVRHHEAYDLGQPRLSCVFCIYGKRSELITAGRHNPELMAEYARVEQAIGHRFTNKLSIAALWHAVQDEQAAQAA